MIARLPPGYTHPVLLGRGACGAVYRVRQTGLDRWVALKILPLSNSDDHDRLLAEARTQSTIRLPCIPQIYDAFQWRNTICLVMEWIHGVPLSAVAPPSFTPDFLNQTIASFCHSLSSLHHIAIAHRDLKPQNIIVTTDRGVMLVDLGFARGPREQGQPPSQAQGTLRYMAPEVRHGRSEIDWFRADVYAAGIIVRDLLGNGATTTSGGDVTHPSLSEDPQARPADGAAFALALNDTLRLPPASRQHPEVALFAAPYLCERICDAAVSLLDHGRSQEAYWLLVESLELDPDNSRALELMADFNRRSARPQTRRRLIAAGAIVITTALAIGGVYEAGRRSGSEALSSIAAAGRVPPRGITGNAPFLQRQPIHRPDTALMPLVREIKPPPGVINGRIHFAGRMPGWGILIDGRRVDTAAPSGIGLADGDHDIRATAPDGGRMVRERVHLLPFEEKTIDLSPR